MEALNPFSIGERIKVCYSLLVGMMMPVLVLALNKRMRKQIIHCCSFVTFNAYKCRRLFSTHTHTHARSFSLHFSCTGTECVHSLSVKCAVFRVFAIYFHLRLRCEKEDETTTKKKSTTTIIMAMKQYDDVDGNGGVCIGNITRGERLIYYCDDNVCIKTMDFQVTFRRKTNGNVIHTVFKWSFSGMRIW